MILTNSIVAGDVIDYTEPVYKGKYPNGKLIGHRQIKAKVISESYGDKKQQHTFTLEVIACIGVEAIERGKRIQRKGRKIYAGDPKRDKWDDENERDLIADEKHERGREARRQRDKRKGVSR